MRKIGGRAVAVLLLAAALVYGMTVYLLRYIDEGKSWAMYFSRANSGAAGELLDRNGIVLARFDKEGEFFSPDSRTRMANFHVTGDYWDRTGTGAISRLRKSSQDFSLLTGTTHSEASSMSLSVDARLNNRIFQLLGMDKAAAVMVCNYKTGELLGMVSTPTIDPLHPEEELPEGAYLNRCLAASYIPGSVFKLITAAAAIENIPELDDMRFYCYEECEIAGVTIKCTDTHFEQSFSEALANSCNIAFAELAVKLGQERLIGYVKDYGFLDSQQLDGMNSRPGSYPLEFVGDPETAWSGIGQSTDLICPYAMLRFLCAVANDGLLIPPHMSGEAGEAQRLVDEATAKRLKELMAFNVTEHYGGEDNFPGLKLCAKTGTAELGDGDSHSWFVGFLDDEKHPYAFVTLVERGGYGLSNAGKISNDLLQWAVVNIDQ